MKLLFGTLLYIVSTFAVQATSHFAINKDHYAAITIMRQEPNFALGFSSMIIQGILMCSLYKRLCRDLPGVLGGWIFALLCGLFLSSYIALAEPGKYAVPSIASWIAVETSAAFVQFSLFGVALGWLFRNNARIPSAAR